MGIGLITIVLISGCAAYRSDTEAEFDSSQVSGLPVIHVGEIEETPDKLEYLGWVEATVTRLTHFHDKPTREQVDVALGLKGQERGANAVIYVSYKDDVLGLSLTGKGQAVKLADEHKYVRALPAKDEKKEIYRQLDNPVDENPNDLPVGVTMVEATPNDLPAGVVMIDKTPSAKAPVIDAPTPASQTITATQKRTIIKIEERLVAPEIVSLTEEAERKRENEAIKAEAAIVKTEVTQCETVIQQQCDNNQADFASFDRSELYMMRSNAEFVRDNARKKDIRQAAERMINLLQTYLARLDQAASETR